MNNKKRWTIIDTLIVVLVIVAGVAVFKVFGGNTKMSGDTKTIDAVVLLAQEDSEVGEAITVGDEITISLAEKDSGTLKDVRVEPSEMMTYNSIDGKYVIEPVENKVDIYATVELKVTENDFALTCGDSVIKVGEKLPFRGKGYALTGYVIDINE